MKMDLTTSKKDRQHILHNEMIMEEVRTLLNLKDEWTKEEAAAYFGVDIKTLERCMCEYAEELSENGMKEDVLDFLAFLNLAMVLSDNEKAKELRLLLLDVAIDLVNVKTGGGTKYVTPRHKEYQLISGTAEDELEQLMMENQEVLIRLKVRD